MASNLLVTSNMTKNSASETPSRARPGAAGDPRSPHGSRTTLRLVVEKGFVETTDEASMRSGLELFGSGQNGGETQEFELQVVCWVS